MLSFWSNPSQSKAQPAQPTAAPGTSVDKNGAVTHHLPGVFVPNCQDGTVIFPTTRRKPSGKKRTVIPPPPTSITNCTLLSDGGVGHVAWAPPAAPPIRRPSRCMSVDANGIAIAPDYVPKAIGETIDVGNLANSPGQAITGPSYQPQEAPKPPNVTFGHTVSTSEHSRSKSAAPKVPSSSKPSAINVGGSVSSSKRPGLKARGKSHFSMHDIVRKVRTHLSSNSWRQPRSSEASTQSAPTARKTAADDIETASVCRRGSCQYILNDGEVQGVVEIVVHEMCKHSAGPVDKDQTKALQPGEEALSQKRVTRKPSCLMNAREPQVSDAAEPATTISLPETAFFARSQSDGQIRARVRSSKVSMTTILSKDNVTDIRWGSDDTKPENETQGDTKDVPTTNPEGDPSAKAGIAANVKAEDDQEQPKGIEAAEHKDESTKNNEAIDGSGSAEIPATGPRLHEISDCDVDDLSDYGINNQPTSKTPPAEDGAPKDVDTKSSVAINQELKNRGIQARTPDAAEPKDSKEASLGWGQADEAYSSQSGPRDAESGGLKQGPDPDGPTSKEVNVKSTDAVEPSSNGTDSAGPDPTRPDAKEEGTRVPNTDQDDPQQLDVPTSDGEPAESTSLKSRFLETFLKSSNDAAVGGASGDSEIPREARLQKENSKASVHDGVDDHQNTTSFTPLNKRRDTHEWQSPPYGAIPEEQETDDLYHLGVDARPGGALPATDSHVSRPDPMTRYNFGLFNRSVFGESTHDATSKSGRRVSEASIMTVAAAAPRSTDKVLYRSRSAHFADVSNSDPGFLQKLTRKLSSVFQTPPQKPVVRAPAPSLESTAISRKASESHIAGDSSEAEGVDAAGYISEPERSSVYQAMTVSKPAKVEAQRRSICSEDNAPQRIDAVTSLKGLIGSGGR
ncbi:hypothetical protein CKAH01_15455 [Colletotrichum kahawae]|uniref:Uncharacterized protein n=1 Tax=Colletotrichum kahawae TaxID=34407 RepID=A0AAD9YJA6_COLKA|nr:hypothetical protein CKAH01_15455 [Colletotrichum kahawae]